MYDPKAMPNAKQIFSDTIEFCNNAPDAIAGSDCVMIATEWDEFKHEIGMHPVRVGQRYKV